MRGERSETGASIALGFSSNPVVGGMYGAAIPVHARAQETLIAEIERDPLHRRIQVPAGSFILQESLLLPVLAFSSIRTILVTMHCKGSGERKREREFRFLLVLHVARHASSYRDLVRRFVRPESPLQRARSKLVLHRAPRTLVSSRPVSPSSIVRTELEQLERTGRIELTKGSIERLN